MRRTQYKVFFRVDECTFFLGITSPKQEDNACSLVIEAMNGCIGELLPTLVLVTCRLIGLDCQHRIQQQNAFTGPFFKVAMARNRKAEVLLNLLVNIAQ